MKAEAIFRALGGYRVAAAVKAAVELDCFSAIAEGRRTAAAISAGRGGTERSVRILLDAVAGHVPQILRKRAGRYVLTPLSRKFLIASSPTFIGPLVPLYTHPSMWNGFRDLAGAVRAGTSVTPTNAHSRGQAFWLDFARATARDAPPKARKLAGLLGRIPEPCDILDLACGSGAYGITLAREVPGARVTLFDQHHVVAAARRGVKAPVRWKAGDLFRTPFGGPYDIILASHVFHHFSPQECARLARKAARALKPGGRLVLQEFVPDEKRQGDSWALLFALAMLVWTREGDAYTFGQYRKWLAAAGLRRIRFHRLNLPADAITASKS